MRPSSTGSSPRRTISTSGNSGISCVFGSAAAEDATIARAGAFAIVGSHDRSPQPETAISFGFRNVEESERQGLVNRVFATVAERYDLMNDLMSGGLHRLWKEDLIAQLNPPRDDRAFRLLDVAGGTADVTLRYARASGPNATAMLCDISPEMIAVGQRRVHEAGLESRITFTEGNAEALPFADEPSTPTRSPSAFAT